MTERSATDPEARTASDPDEPADSSEADADSPKREEDPAASDPAPDGDSTEPDPPPDPPAAGASPESMEEARAEEALTRSLDQLQGEFSALNDRYLRLAAEFTNYRRRQETEMTAAWGRAQADLVRRLLDVLDDLQRVSALDPAEEAATVESIVEGVDLVERKFVRVLDEAGVETVEPGKGEPFDPESMEAMMRVPAGDDAEDDTVAQLFQKGYRFKGHLLRPARVSVHKA